VEQPCPPGHWALALRRMQVFPNAGCGIAIAQIRWHLSQVNAPSTARLAAIWLKRSHRGPMDPVSRATLVAGAGITGNADRSRRRQVTIIEREVWEALMRRLNAKLDPGARRANLMVSGLALANSRDRVLALGACQIRILGELKPCERMEDALPGLEATMYDDWRGGAFGEVLVGGEVSVGDEARWAK
jgi:MOSC domain-containing protein YiiM